MNAEVPVKQIIFVFYLSLFSVIARGESSVLWVTEEWKGFTDFDGSGIYNAVVRMAFAQQGLAVQQEYMPFARSLHLIDTRKADFAGGVSDNVAVRKGYLRSDYPIAITRIQALFHREKLPDWRGIDSLKSGTVVASSYQPEQIGLNSESALVEIVDSREQALNMLLSGRVSYFIEDEKVLNTTLQSRPDVYNDYVVRHVGYSQYFMVSPPGERGSKIMSAYNRGILKLHQSGDLKPIYDRYHMRYPLNGLR